MVRSRLYLISNKRRCCVPNQERHNSVTGLQDLLPDEPNRVGLLHSSSE